MTVVNFMRETAEPIVEKRDVIISLITLRCSARMVCRNIDNLADANSADRRLAKKHRASGGMLMDRAAEVIEARIAEREGAIKTWHDILSGIGCDIRAMSDYIDRLVPTKELLDVLEVNSVDRAKVGPSDGLKEIVFVKGLEDSATHRGSLWKEGPLFRAMSSYFMHAMDTVPELKNVVMDSLWGKGGMFEFVPSYSRNADGVFVRNPPKLRVADEAVDCKAGGVQ